MRDGFAEKRLAEGLGTTRTEGNTVQDERAVVPQQCVILWLMGQHRGVTAFEFQLHTRREQRGDLSHDAPLVRFRPSFRHREIDSVGISLQECHTTARPIRDTSTPASLGRAG